MQKSLKKIFKKYNKFNIEKKEIVAIQGMGFVGSVMSIVTSNSKNKRIVFGLDLPKKIIKKRLESFNKGIFPFKTSDKKITVELKKAIKNKKIYATTDVDIYKIADVIVVDVNLDVIKNKKNRNLKYSYKVKLKDFIKAIEIISKNCKENALILIETTVPPGTTEKVVKPLVYKNLRARKLKTNKIMIAHSYERVMPGNNYYNSIKNYYRVYSAVDKKSEIRAEKFLRSIINIKEYPLTKLNNTNESELAKVLENSFRAMNISFMIEWTRFAEISNVDIYKVVNAIRKRETHKNIMLPGIGVGGYCLPKDTLLADWATENLFDKKNVLNVSKQAIFSNDMMPFYSYRFIKQRIKNISNKKILIFGCAYTGNVGDTRNSPVLDLYKFLKRDNKKIYIHDPYVDYWEEAKLKTINMNKINTIKPDILIFATSHDVYKKNNFILKKLNFLSKGKIIIDLLGIINDIEYKKLIKNYSVEILGKGKNV